MADPVVALDGFSYDRDAILQWFRLSGPPRSPMTGSILTSADLTSNQNLGFDCLGFLVTDGASLKLP